MASLYKRGKRFWVTDWVGGEHPQLSLRTGYDRLARHKLKHFVGELPACVVPQAELIRRLKASKHPTCNLSLSDDGRHLVVNGGRVASGRRLGYTVPHRGPPTTGQCQ